MDLATKFQGRASRNEFGRTLVVTALASIVGVVPIAIAVWVAQVWKLNVFLVTSGVVAAFNVLLASTLLPVIFRRLHDFGLSGRWGALGVACIGGMYFFEFISPPLAFGLGLVTSIGMLGLLIVPGAPIANEYGNPPPKRLQTATAAPIHTVKPSVETQLEAARRETEEAKARLGAYGRIAGPLPSRRRSPRRRGNTSALKPWWRVCSGVWRCQ